MTIKTADQFAKELEKSIRKVFPKAYIISRYSGGITESISVRFALGATKSDWPNGYIENDRLHHLFSIMGGFTPVEKSGPINILSKGASGEGNNPLVEKHTISLLIGGSLFKPGSGINGKKVKFGWKKKTGDAATIVKHVEDYFRKVKKIMDENPDLMESDFKPRNIKESFLHVLNEKSRPYSVVKLLSSQELKQLAKAYNSPKPDKAIQKLDDTEMFDKVLEYFLNGRSISSIPALKDAREGEWLVDQLEFDPKFRDAIKKL